MVLAVVVGSDELHPGLVLLPKVFRLERHDMHITIVPDRRLW